MEDLPLNPANESLDADKEKLKEKIQEILEFPVFLKDESKEFDPKKKAENPDWFPGIIIKLPNNMLAQIIFVIIGEQLAYDTTLFFKDEDDKSKFLLLLSEVGLSVGDLEEIQFPDGIKVNLTMAGSEEYVEKMTEVRKLAHTDRKKFNDEYGKLMMFPQSAIDAHNGETARYVGKGSSKEEWKHYYEKYSQKGLYGQFIYSKEHAPEEHAYFLERNRKLKEYAPQLFEDKDTENS